VRQSGRVQVAAGHISTWIVYPCLASEPRTMPSERIHQSLLLLSRCTGDSRSALFSIFQRLTFYLLAGSASRIASYTRSNGPRRMATEASSSSFKAHSSTSKNAQILTSTILNRSPILTRTLDPFEEAYYARKRCPPMSTSSPGLFSKDASLSRNSRVKRRHLVKTGNLFAAYA